MRKPPASLLTPLNIPPPSQPHALMQPSLYPVEVEIMSTALFTAEGGGRAPRLHELVGVDVPVLLAVLVALAEPVLVGVLVAVAVPVVEHVTLADCEPVPVGVPDELEDGVPVPELEPVALEEGVPVALEEAVAVPLPD